MSQNRITPSNGRNKVPELRLNLVDSDIQLDAAEKIEKAIQNHPGALLIVGFILGGIVGWMTSKHRR